MQCHSSCGAPLYPDARIWRSFTITAPTGLDAQVDLVAVILAMIIKYSFQQGLGFMLRTGMLFLSFVEKLKLV